VLKALEERCHVGAGREPFGLAHDPARGRYPGIWELCTVRQTQTGKTKQPATIKIVAYDAGWIAVLTDLTLSYALEARAECLDDVLRQLELRIGDRSAWREIGYGERARAVKAEDGKKVAPWKQA
jgi:hypothetical protein